MVGELMSVGAAVVWSYSVILFKQADGMAPMGLNALKNVVAMLCLALTMWVTDTTIPTERPLDDWFLLAVSGILGIAFADTLFFAALRRMGPGRLAVVECAYTPFIVATSVLFLGEPLTPVFLIGAGGVFLGVLLASIEKGEGVQRKANQPRFGGEWGMESSRWEPWRWAL